MAPSEDAEHGMLHLDDEIAGLVEAADMPADHSGAHTMKPEPASSVAGKGSVVLDMGSTVLRKVQLHLVSIQWCCHD